MPISRSSSPPPGPARRQAGAEIVAAEEPGYRHVAHRAEAILERCHDLRVAVHFILGATWQRGFPGLAEGTSYLRGVLETFRVSCHPGLDRDDPEDMALFRVNTMRGLMDGATVLRAVRHAPLARANAFGRVTLCDLEVADGERAARGPKPRPTPSPAARSPGCAPARPSTVHMSAETAACRVATLAGFEPATCPLGGGCSIRLSHRA